MAATQTVPQHPQDRNFYTRFNPRLGVLTLFGYGIQVHVERGHLIIKDGIASDRREFRFSRVGHGLRRLVVIGADGLVSLAALRWLADQDASFVMLERNGSVLATTGPVRPSDTRLRRAQALAQQNGIALEIARGLIARKLAGQERLIRETLRESALADEIAQARVQASKAEAIPLVRQWEAQGANAYWSAWRKIPIGFPQRDLRRVPDHWRVFGTRKSLLTGSPRLAVNPPNAMLNYLYALLESESRLALATLGLDPGIGVLHMDTPSRDSLACDLMEAVRPEIDGYLLDWIRREPLNREWFFEQRDGNCRLMAKLAVRLAETAPTWANAVAPIAEWISKTLWSTLPKPARQIYPANRLTQGRRRMAKGRSANLPNEPTPQPIRICRNCGASINRGKTYCAACGVIVSRRGLIEAARLGRIATHTPSAEALRAATQRRQAAARRAWNPSDKPAWLTEKVYREKIQPLLAGVKVPRILTALAISEPYATEIRKGKRLPHPRHWLSLARLVGCPCP